MNCALCFFSFCCRGTSCFTTDAVFVVFRRFFNTDRRRWLIKKKEKKTVARGTKKSHDVEGQKKPSRAIFF